MTNIVFDALCLKCGKRKGIELPRDNMNTSFAIMQAMAICDVGFCKCGGYVEAITYDGYIDSDRKVHEL